MIRAAALLAIAAAVAGAQNTPAKIPAAVPRKRQLPPRLPTTAS